MGRVAFSKTKILMLRESKRPFSKITGEIVNRCNGNAGIKDSSSWVPHPMSGIYFPKGHEWVMDDVPDRAASFDGRFWVRNVDGVDKPDGDHYFHANM